MEKGINHRPYILIGCLIWIVSFFGEAFRFQPYSTIGILISPMLTFFGIYHWFMYYKLTKGHYPKFFKAWKGVISKMRKNPFAGIGFMFSHILETWTFIIVCWMGMIFIMFLTFGQSKAFKAAKEYCENDSEILEKTGEIRYYGLLVGGSISTKGQSGESELTFTIVGENGNFNANAELIKYNDAWELTELKVQ